MPSRGVEPQPSVLQTDVHTNYTNRAKNLVISPKSDLGPTGLQPVALPIELREHKHESCRPFNDLRLKVIDQFTNDSLFGGSGGG